TSQSRSKRTGSLLREYMCGRWGHGAEVQAAHCIAARAGILSRLPSRLACMPRLRRPLPTTATIALLLLGSLGAAAAWVLVAMALDRQSSWMALVAAADAALILRMARMRPGAWRALAGVAATLLAIAAANWGIVAA